MVKFKKRKNILKSVDYVDAFYRKIVMKNSQVSTITVSGELVGSYFYEYQQSILTRPKTGETTMLLQLLEMR